MVSLPNLTIGQVVLDVFDNTVTASYLEAPATLGGADEFLEKIAISQDRARQMEAGVTKLKDDLCESRVHLDRIKKVVSNRNQAYLNHNKETAPSQDKVRLDHIKEIVSSQDEDSNNSPNLRIGQLKMYRPHGSQDEFYHSSHNSRQIPRQESQEYFTEPYNGSYYRDERQRVGACHAPTYPEAYSGHSQDNYGVGAPPIHRGYHEDARGFTTSRTEYDLERYEERYLPPASYPQTYAPPAMHPHYPSTPLDYGRSPYFGDHVPSYGHLYAPASPMHISTTIPMHPYQGHIYYSQQTTPQLSLKVKESHISKGKQPSSPLNATKHAPHVTEYEQNLLPVRYVQRSCIIAESEVTDSFIEQDFDRYNTQVELPCRKLFIRHVSAHVSRSQVGKVFEQYGPVREIIDEHIRSRGIAFVSFWDIHYSLPKRNEDITGPCTKENHQGTLVVCITGPDSPFTDADVHHLFSRYGDIKCIRNLPRRSARKFVEFYDERACQAAYSALDGSIFKGGRISVRYTWDYPREMRLSTDQIKNNQEKSEYPVKTRQGSDTNLQERIKMELPTPRRRRSRSPPSSHTTKSCDSTTNSYDSTTKSCDKTAKSCDSTTKSCEDTMRSCDNITKSCEITTKSCGDTMRSCDSIIKSCDSITRSCDSIARPCDNITGSCCNAPPSGHVVEKALDITPPPTKIQSSVAEFPKSNTILSESITTPQANKGAEKENEPLDHNAKAQASPKADTEQLSKEGSQSIPPGNALMAQMSALLSMLQVRPGFFTKLLATEPGQNVQF